MKLPDYYTIDELMVTCLARTIQDGDIVFNGVAVALPFLAISLAKKTHASGSVFLGGLQGAVNPDYPFLPPLSVDYIYNYYAELTVPVEDIFNMVPRGRIDRIFFGGGQIDRYGNANNTLIGNVDGIKVKLPGGAGASSISCSAKNFTLWTTKHLLSEAARKKNLHTLVEKVDYITTVGHVTPEGTRKELNLRGGGPDWVITDLGVFDFAGQSNEMRLKFIHPEVTLDVVRENTGFGLLIDDNLQTTPPPTREQVGIIRKLDPLNIRKRLFNGEELNKRYRFI